MRNQKLEQGQQVLLPKQHIYLDTETTGVRTTSINAFNSIIDKLPMSRLKVLNAIIRIGGKATNRQIGLEIMQPINRVTPRVNELVKMGVLRFGGHTYDSTTKKQVCYWEINN